MRGPRAEGPAFGRTLYPCCLTEDAQRHHFSLAVDRRVHRLLDLIDEFLRVSAADGYPPAQIQRTGEDTYRISLALAGFMPEDISVTAKQNVLTVEGRKAEKADRDYLYQGISGRPFQRVCLGEWTMSEARLVVAQGRYV